MDWPIRQTSAHGTPKPATRTQPQCWQCGADQTALAPQHTGQRGIWTHNYRWFCSTECRDANQARRG